MKKTLGIILSASLVLSSVALPIFAEVDTATSPTVPAEAPAAPAAPAKPAAPTAATSAQAVAGPTYTVVSGDVFWKIAQKHNLTVAELAKLNPQIKNTSLIYPGQKITVKAGATTPAVAAAKKLYHGFGEISNYRPSKDHLNLTTASVIFDEAGKIVSLNWEVMEITKALFPAWPEEADKEAFRQSVDFKWETKKEEGDAYNMKRAAASGKEWWEQMAFYEKYFVGKTVAEVEAWAAKYCDQATMRPYKMAYPDKLTDADKAAVANFTDAEKKMLVDVTTGATMSLEDDHSKFISALKEAYANKAEFKY